MNFNLSTQSIDDYLAIKIEDTRTERGYMNPGHRYGRTTKLIVKDTGGCLFEGVGIHTRRALFATWRGMVEKESRGWTAGGKESE